MPTLSQSHKSPVGLSPWGFQHTAKLSVHTKHMTHYTVTMQFIQAHGHFAAITKDGLLALSEVWTPNAGFGRAFGENDTLCEEPKLFDVDEDGMVASREVREWLGY